MPLCRRHVYVVRAMGPLAVLVRETGEVIEGEQAGTGPPGLLEGLGNGAYTSALLSGPPFAITDWALHERRLNK